LPRWRPLSSASEHELAIDVIQPALPPTLPQLRICHGNFPLLPEEL
jgi:hypothetical protein